MTSDAARASSPSAAPQSPSTSPHIGEATQHTLPTQDSPQPKPVIPPQRFERVPWRSIVIFSVIAYAIMAVCAAPFWILEGGVTHPLYTWIISLAMFGPLLATVVVAKAVDKESWRTAVGLRFRGRWKRIGIWSVLALLLVLGINLATGVIMVLRGVPGDLTGRSWAQIVQQQLVDAGAPMPVGLAALVILAATAVNLVFTCGPTLGEEAGWRGWLWPRLAPLGRVRAIVLGGAIWSLWHLPIVLIGHNYPGANRLAAVAMFLPACMAMNLLFGAITERAIGNPIPAAIAHSTLNSTLGLALGLFATTQTPAAMNWFLDTATGLTGIILFIAIGLAILPRTRPTLDGRVTRTAESEHGSARTSA